MADFFTLVEKLGGISGISFSTVMLLIVIGSYKKVWVWGWQLDKAEAQSLEWKTMALQATKVTESSVDIAKRTRN